MKPNPKVNDLQRQLKSKTEIIQNLEREISETNVAYKARGGLKGGLTNFITINANIDMSTDDISINSDNTNDV